MSWRSDPLESIPEDDDLEWMRQLLDDIPADEVSRTLDEMTRRARPKEARGFHRSKPPKETLEDE